MHRAKSRRLRLTGSQRDGRSGTCYPRRMRICLVYDCLFPLHGRRRRALVSQPRRASRRRRPRGHLPDAAPVGARRAGEIPGVRVVAAGPRMALYREAGRGGSRRRSCSAPACSGTCCATAGATTSCTPASFPYFSLLAAAVAAPLRPLPAGGRLARGVEPRVLARVSRRLGGRIGAPCSAAACACRQRAFCFAELPARRLREEGLRGEVTVLEGVYAGAAEPRPPCRPSRSWCSPGRHIPEKRRRAVVPAVALARERMPGLRGAIFGDGPERDRPCSRRSPSIGAEDCRRRARVRRRPSEVERDLAPRAVPGAAVAPRGLRDGRRRGGRAAARRASSCATPTTPPPS